MKKIISWTLVVAILCSVCILNVFAAEYGDINCDGSVKISDAVLLSQYLALWEVNISSEGMEAADVRYDGVVNTKDAVLLAQYLALWEVNLGPSGSTPTPGIPDVGGDNDENDPGIGDNEVPAGDIY